MLRQDDGDMTHIVEDSDDSDDDHFTPLDTYDTPRQQVRGGIVGSCENAVGISVGLAWPYNYTKILPA